MFTSNDTESATSPLAIAEVLRSTLEPSRVRLNEPLAPYTTFQIGGPADVLYDATSADDLASAISAARAAGIPWFLLGLGANILVGDRECVAS